MFAFFYTTGPYPLSYNGWGDALVIVFFGFVPVGGTYYVQALTWTPNVTIASFICGLIVDTLLVVNNYRDREADAQSGKRTVVVRFGETLRQIPVSDIGNYCCNIEPVAIVGDTHSSHHNSSYLSYTAHRHLAQNGKDT